MDFVGDAAKLPRPWSRGSAVFVEAIEDEPKVHHAGGYDLFLRELAREGVSTAGWDFDETVNFFVREGRAFTAVGRALELSAAIFLGNVLISAAGRGHWSVVVDSRPEVCLGDVSIDVRLTMAASVETTWAI